MSTPEIVPSFEQKQIAGAPDEVFIDLSVPPPPELDRQLPTSRFEEIQRAAQQIVFLPNFYVTSCIFYGEKIDSTDESEGLPTVRSAWIRGNNFDLDIKLNYNYRETRYTDTIVTIAYIDDSRSFATTADGGNSNLSHYNWLLESVLIPVRDELMMQGAPTPLRLPED